MTVARSLFEIFSLRLRGLRKSVSQEPMRAYVALVKGLCLECNRSDYNHIANKDFEPLRAENKEDQGFGSRFYYEFSDYSMLVLYVNAMSVVFDARCYETPMGVLDDGEEE